MRQRVHPLVCAVGLTLAIACGAARADVRLSGLFTDRVILQRDQPVPVWGTAAAGEHVSVEFADQVKQTIAGAAGRWSVQLEPSAASNEPRRLVARGRNTVAVDDVLVGEIWLFSGQSNMAMLMSSMARPNERDPVWPERARRDMAAANDPWLREFRVDNRPAERPKDDVITRTGWMTWNPKDAAGWAAMAAYFGQRLRSALGVPVGIVMCAWGGSGCSAWISAETLRGPELNTLWPEEIPEWRPNLAPSRLYNGMLHSLAPFAIAGFGWYQGETEATPYHNPYVHRFLLAGMIQDWRRRWGRPELPFYLVQLPNRDNEPRWVVVRESQAAALHVARTEMIPTIDIGQAWDLHPKNKPDVANRLADAVLGREYSRGTWPGLPRVERVTRAGDTLRVGFLDAKHGLKTTDGRSPAGFLIAGKDRRFHPAEARLDAGAIVVRSPAVPTPEAVRYAWEPAPMVNLTNTGGIPVPPFRSDDWPVDGSEKVAQPLPVRATLTHQISGGSLAAGKATGWRPCTDLTRLGEAAPLVLRGAGAAASILSRGFPVLPGAHPSPEVFWTAEVEINPALGVTFEAKAHVTRVGNPDRGLDIEVGVRSTDRAFRRYLVTAFPMRLHTFQNNLAPRNSLATETHVLRSDLAAEIGTYRLAVRPDGIAQIYHNGQLVGTTAGETVVQDVPPRSYLRVGKTVARGEWAATLHHVAFDDTGAHAPRPLTPNEVKELRAGIDEP